VKVVCNNGKVAHKNVLMRKNAVTAELKAIIVRLAKHMKIFNNL